jgi:hypothetical protein
MHIGMILCSSETPMFSGIQISISYITNLLVPVFVHIMGVIQKSSAHSDLILPTGAMYITTYVSMVLFKLQMNIQGLHAGLTPYHH